jgi:hypothetical protein
MPVVRSQKPNPRRKNHVESQPIASTIYRRSLVAVSRQCCDFSDEFEVDPTSLVTPLAVFLLLDFMDLKLEVYSSSYSKFR